jgi:hypothetical protein
VPSVEQIKNVAFFNEERILILGTGTYSKDLHPTLILPQSPKINLDRMLQVLKHKS